MSKCIMNVVLEGNEEELNKILSEHSDIIKTKNKVPFPSTTPQFEDEIITDDYISTIASKARVDELSEKEEAMFRNFLKEKPKMILEYKSNNIPVVQANTKFTDEITYCYKTVDPAARLVFGDDVPEEWESFVEEIGW